MNSKIAGGLCVAALALGAGQAAWAQESSNRVAANTDWSVFVEGDPQECWSVSRPQETVNTRDGNVVSVTRGDILMFVSFRPGSDISGEVSFTGGYPFASGSTVEVTVGDSSFTMFTEGEWAWTSGPDEDAAIIDAMRAGTTATLVANSSRGTRTQDTFSLLGFTAAYEDAASRCQ